MKPDRNTAKLPMRSLLSPPRFDPFARKAALVFFALSAILLVPGLLYAFWLAPTDGTQGENYRIMYLHVPASWMAMFIFLMMALWSIGYLVFRTKVSHVMTEALAPTGALMAALSLVTGMLWGKPTWGAYWVWDARLTSMLVLLFLYFAYIALVSGIENRRRAAFAGSVLAVIGAFNVPVVHFSVTWWNTLHQGASVSVKSGVSMHPSMFLALLLMTFAVWFYCVGAVLVRARILLRAKGLLAKRGRT